jgi:hypothetical protein
MTDEHSRPAPSPTRVTRGGFLRAAAAGLALAAGLGGG